MFELKVTEETSSLMLNVPATLPWSSMKNKILFHDCMCYVPYSFVLCPMTLAAIGPVTEFMNTSVLPVFSIQRSC